MIQCLTPKFLILGTKEEIFEGTKNLKITCSKPRRDKVILFK